MVHLSCGRLLFAASATLIFAPTTTCFTPTLLSSNGGVVESVSRRTTTAAAAATKRKNVSPLVLTASSSSSSHPVGDGAHDHRSAAIHNNNNKNNRRNFLTQASATTICLGLTQAPLFAFAECSCAAEEVVKDLMESQKTDLIKDMKKDQKNDVKAEQDTDKLISSLKSASKEAKAAPTVSTQKDDLAKALQLIDAETRDLIDQLELEEEQIGTETLDLMRKVETLEAAAERLNRPLLDEPDATDADSAVAKSKQETIAFLEKLKKRSADKEEFIKLLKQESTAFGSNGKIDLKLPEFVANLKKTAESDREFDISLNSFRERLQKGFGSGSGSGKK